MIKIQIPKQIGIIGLGRMGMQIGRRLLKKGFGVTAWNRNPKKRRQFRKFGGKVRASVPELAFGLKRPRTIWLMLPAHETDAYINQLSKLLSPGDIVIDGSNSFYKDSQKRANKLARYKIHYLDAGVSGGVWGEKNGFSIMVGGDGKVFKKVAPIFRALAADDGKSYGLVGKNGAGHFVKMVHNGIEYGMMEAIAEGFAILDRSPFNLDLAQVAKIWHKGAVVSSWLVDLARDIFEKEDLRKVVGLIPHTGEGEWTIREARRLGVDIRVIADAFKVRLESGKKKNQNKFSNKVVALLRNRFGGHEVTRRDGSSRT